MTPELRELVVNVAVFLGFLIFVWVLVEVSKVGMRAGGEDR